MMVERALPGAWVGYRLEDLEVAAKLKIVALTRAGKAVLPKPGTVGQENDLLYVAVTVEGLEGLEERLRLGPRS